jgi:hypothetical protein
MCNGMKKVKKYFRSLWATFSKKKNNCIVFVTFLDKAKA